MSLSPGGDKKQKKFIRNVAQFIVNNNLVISTIDKPDFQILFDQKLPFRQTLSNIILPEMVKEKRIQLDHALKTVKY
jgi:hypothetical protein